MRANNAKTKECVNIVHKVIKTKQTPRDADSDVHRGFDDALDQYMLAAVGSNAVEELT